MASIGTRWTSLVALGAVAAGLAACGSSTSDGGAGGGGPAASAQEVRSDKPRDESPSVPATDYQTFLSGTNDFGFDLYKQVAKDDANAFFSPTSTAVALAMTYAGANGNTDAEMAKVLHNALPKAQFHAAFDKLALDLASRNVALHPTDEGDKSLKLSLVDAAWMQRGYGILAPYLDTLAISYGAGVHTLDFAADPDGSRGVINQWVEEQTEGKITDLLTPGSITADARLVLTNTLYFYGSWGAVFDKQQTHDGVFHVGGGADATVPMMHRTGGFSYAEGADFAAVELPYDGGKVAMTVVLPADGHASDVRSAMSAKWLSDVGSSLAAWTGGEVSVTLPKFKFTWGTKSLKEGLKSLGMMDAWTFGAADFSGIEPKRELYIADVLHKAYVAIDESGTEAAAATAVVMNAGGIPTPPKDFTVDRPFFVVIHDDAGAVLFVGQVFDPRG